MKYYFENIKSHVAEDISNSNNQSLKSEKFKEQLLRKHSISFPELNKSKVDIKIDNDKLRMDTAPSGFSFTPGKEYDYAMFTVPLTGDVSFFKEALKTFRFDRFFKLDYDKLIFIEFSNSTLSDNDTEIARIKKVAQKKFESIENVIDKHRDDVSDFNNKLKSFIKERIEREVEKRESKKSSESRLNPFD